MKLYLAGPIRNNSEAEYRFNAIADMLTDEGYDVFNPYKFVKTYGLDKNSEKAIMMALLPELACCDGAFFMRDWYKSEGATLEHALAVYLNKTGNFKIMYE